jgi:hypothetical protein
VPRFAVDFAGGRRLVAAVLRVVVERVPERAGDRPPLVLVGTHYTLACARARRAH